MRVRFPHPFVGRKLIQVLYERKVLSMADLERIYGLPIAEILLDEEEDE